MTPVLVEGAEKDRALRSLSTGAWVQFLLEQDPQNRDTIDTWIGEWAPGALEACRALAPAFEIPEHPTQSFEQAFARVCADWQSTLKDHGLRVPEEATR